MTSPADPAASPEFAALRRRHLALGWWSLALFAGLGAVLESLHGWKVDWYLAVGNETRRLLWRLAHAHGTFLALVHIAFALTVAHTARAPRLASGCLSAASLCLPLGFLLAGLDAKGGDPGIAIALVPFGALLLVTAAIATARAVR